MLNIETSFLNRADIKVALRVNEINAVKRALTSGKKKRFEQSIELSKLVQNAVNWYESQAGKDALNEAGITWKKEDLFKNVFGFQKSFSYKLLKASEVEAEKVEEFKALCSEAEREGEDAPLSVEGLLKWVKDGGSVVREESEGEGEGEESEGGRSTIFTLSFKRKAISQDADAKNVAIRVDDDGAVITKNSREEIEFAIAFLRAALES